MSEFYSLVDTSIDLYIYSLQYKFTIYILNVKINKNTHHFYTYVEYFSKWLLVGYYSIRILIASKNNFGLLILLSQGDLETFFFWNKRSN